MPDAPDPSSPSEKEIFLRALEIEDLEERASWIADACGADDELHRNVEGLLAAAAEDDSGLVLEPDLLDDEFVRELLEQGGAGTEGPLAALPSPGGTVTYFGDYELLEEIARGAMGVIFRARQSTLNRIVAVKMIRGSILSSEADIRRFKAEPESAASLDHPNIVPIYEVGEFEEQHYFSMKLIQGGTLADRLAELGRDQRAAARLMATVARAVHHAHQHGILHRDLKPGNILVDEGGHPHVTDFGLAKQMGSDSSLTLSGQIMGTPYYMAPEQATGDTRNLSTAADIYSLGAILFEILTGRPPFKGDSVIDTFRLVREEEVPRLSSLVPDRPIDRDLETIAAKCLQKKPGDRYSSADEFADDLVHWLAGEPITARPVTALERTIKWVRRKPVAAALAGVAFLLLLTLGVGGPIVAVRQNALAEQARGAERAAVESEEKAIDALGVAEERARTIRRNLYAAEMNLAGAASAGGGGMAEILRITDRWNPGSGEGDDPEDLRGWEWYYLRASASREIKKFTHPNPTGRGLGGLAYSPDGGRIATYANGEYKTRIWSSNFESLIHEFDEYGETMTSLSWGPTGRFLAGGGWGQSLKVYDTRNLEEVGFSTGLEVRTHTPNAAWSHQGDRVVTAGRDGPLTIWNGKAVQRIRRVPLDPGCRTWWITWSPDDQALLVAYHHGSRKGQAVLLDAGSGEVTWRSSPPDGVEYMGHMAWNPGGTCIAIAGSDDKIHLLDAKTGEILESLVGHQGTGQQGRVLWMAWSPDGSLLASAGDTTIRVWDSKDRYRSRIVGEHLDGAKLLTWSPDGKYIASSSKRLEIKIWDVARRTHQRTIKAFDLDAIDISWSPDGARLVAASKGGQVSILDPGTDDPSKTITTEPRPVYSVDWAADGKLVASTGRGGRIDLWDPESGERISQISGLKGKGMDCDISADGKLIVGIGNGNLLLWDRDEQQTRFTKKIQMPERHGVDGASLSPDGRFVACVDGRTIRVWETADGREHRAFDFPVKSRASIVYSGISWHPDGKRLCAAGRGSHAWIWDIESGQLIQTLSGHGGSLSAACWNPDGSRLATASADGTCRIWDPVSGNLLLTLETGHGLVRSVRWHPDGRSLATCGNDGSIKIWDAGKGYEMEGRGN